MKTTHLIYFSPAFSTKKIMNIIGENTNNIVVEYDITQGLTKDIEINSDDIVVFGVPVYAGRLPEIATNILKEIKSNNTTAIISVVYGNRDYDDALLELYNIVNSNGFNIVGAGAFVARHSIFPKVAANRPDENDILDIINFTKECLTKNTNNTKNTIQIKGNIPYKQPGKIPLTPKGDNKCNNCGTCVKMCPSGAIDKNSPRKTNKKFCISCTRCIAICPQKSRNFNGIFYKLISKKFVSALSIRKDSETFFIN